MKTNPNTKNILVIDHDQDSRTLLSTFFKEHQNHFLYINSNKEAVQAARQPIDLIFIELHAICYNCNLLSRIKALKSNTPLIALTACAMNDERTLSLQSGCGAYIAKPFNSKSLLQLINAIQKKLILKNRLTE